MTGLSVNKANKTARKFLEELYPGYEAKSIQVNSKTDGYDIDAQMEERFNPSKRYHASISVSVTVIDY